MKRSLALSLLLVGALGACALPPEPVNASAQALTNPCLAGQTWLTVQRTGSSGVVLDAEVRASNPTTNYGTQTAQNAGYYGLSTERDSLFWFDLSTAPARAIVDSARLDLTNGVVAPTSGTLTVLPLTSAWSETGVTFATQPGAGSSIGSVTNSGSAGSAFSVPLLTSAVQTWVTTPAANFGVVLREVSPGVTNTYASDFTTVSKRPAADICYHLPPPTSCSDGIKNGTETDVDCGGSCSPCANGLLCLVPADCLTTSECDPWDTRCHALGGPSITPVSTCSLPVQTALAPTTVAYGIDPAQVVDVYQNASPTGRCLVDIHGGGGTGGDKSDPLAVVPFALMRAGTVGDTVFAINYRVATGSPPSVVGAFPAGLNDVRAFLTWLPSNAATYGCSPSRVVLVGFSMGSILAAQAAMTLDLPVVGGFQHLPNGTALDDASAAAGTVKALVSYYLGSDFTLPSADISASSLTNLPVYFNGATAGGPVYADGSPSKTLHPIATPFIVLAASGDPFLYASQSAGTAVYPLSSGHTVLGFDPALRARGNASTFVGASTSSGVGHMFVPTAGGAYLPANCTVAAFINAQ